MNVLGLFDGISCGQVALERAGVPVEKYYASEIDKNNIYKGMYSYYKITPLEAERLQTLPDNYTSCISSKAKRISLCGNGWTVDVIAHIFKGLPKI